MNNHTQEEILTEFKHLVAYISEKTGFERKEDYTYSDNLTCEFSLGLFKFCVSFRDYEKRLMIRTVPIYYKDISGNSSGIFKSNSRCSEGAEIGCDLFKGRERILKDYLSRFVAPATEYWMSALKIKEEREALYELMRVTGEEVAIRTGGEFRIYGSDHSVIGKNLTGRISYDAKSLYIDRITVTKEQFIKINSILGGE
jgi:hypothetical protein